MDPCLHILEKQLIVTTTRYIQGYTTLGIYYRLCYVHLRNSPLVTTPTFAFHLGRYGESVILKRNVCNNYYSVGNLVNTIMSKINVKPKSIKMSPNEYNTGQVFHAGQPANQLCIPEPTKNYNLICTSRQKCKKMSSIFFR